MIDKVQRFEDCVKLEVGRLKAEGADRLPELFLGNLSVAVFIEIGE